MLPDGNQGTNLSKWIINYFNSFYIQDGLELQDRIQIIRKVIIFVLKIAETVQTK